MEQQGTFFDPIDKLSGRVKEQMKKRLPENFSPSDSEYITSDKKLVLCKKCGLPRYALEYNIFTKCEMYNRKQCDCDREDELRKFNDERAREKALYYDSPVFLRSVGEKYRNARFKDIPTEGCDSTYLFAKNQLERFLGSIESNLESGKGWYLWSEETGVGKTCLASCVRRELLDSGIPCVLMTDINIINDCESRRFATGEFDYATYYDVKVLIIDDLGTDATTDGGRVSKLTNRWMNDIINQRYLNHKLTCFTSNFSKRSLMDIGFDKRIVDRIMEMAPAEMRITGRSFREQLDKAAREGREFDLAY